MKKHTKTLNVVGVSLVLYFLYGCFAAASGFYEPIDVATSSGKVSLGYLCLTPIVVLATLLVWLLSRRHRVVLAIMFGWSVAGIPVLFLGHFFDILGCVFYGLIVALFAFSDEKIARSQNPPDESNGRGRE